MGKQLRAPTADRRAPAEVAPLRALVLTSHRPTSHLVERALRSGPLGVVTVLHAADGRNALAALRHDQPDVVLADPSTDGTAAVLASGAAPVVLLGEGDATSLALEALSTGAAGSLLVPGLDGNGAAAAVRSALGRGDVAVTDDPHPATGDPVETARLRAVLEHGDDVAMFFDELGRITWVSSNSARLFGLAPEELVGLDAFELVHPEDRDRVVQLVDERLQRPGDHFRAEFRVVGDGPERWLEETVTLLPFGSPAGASVASMRSISARKEAETWLRFQADLLSAVGQAVAATDLDGRIIYLNPAAERLYGWRLDDARGRNGGEISVSPRSGDGADMVVRQARSGKAWSGDLWLRRKDGSEFYGHVTNTPMLDADGRCLGLIGVTTDLTERMALARRAEDDRDRLAAAQRSAHLGSFDVDLATGTITFSDELYRILGLPVGSPVDGTTYLARVHPDDEPMLQRSTDDALAGDNHTANVHRIVRPDGEVRWVEARNSTPPDAVGRLCGTVLDITERHRAEERIQHEMRHDALTGLPNRSEITRRLDALLQQQRDGGPPVTVGFLDLDRFKVINDGLGHATGDRVLLEVARRLGDAMGPDATVGRFGGDEFVVVQPGPATPRSAVATMVAAVQRLEEPIEIDHRRFFVTASVGVTVSSIEDDSDVLLQATDTAMYEAKRTAEQRVTYFDDELRARARRGHQIESDLRHALDHGELDVHYQPVLRISDGRCVGVEALLRWEHPHLGSIGPADFIPVAEETGMIVPLGAWVLERALEQLAEWHQDPAHQHMWVAVNLSANQLVRTDVDSAVAAALDRAGVSPRSLHLEITESVLMDRIDGSLEALHSLRRLGIHLSVDDFGTGYSSLSYLKRLPVQTLKIDRSFTDGLGTDPHDTSIVRAIGALSDELGLELLAEGVETEAHLGALRALGCDLGQGFWWSPPLSATEATRWLRDRS